MPHRRFTLRAPEPFDFELTVRSHGWYALPPFSWDANAGELRYAFCLDDDRAVAVAAKAGGRNGVKVRVDSEEALSAEDMRRVRDAMRGILRLDDDLGEFYELIADEPRLAWVARRGGGRILRCATAFEDIIKIVCTTNCSWSLTESMVGNLVEAAGVAAPGGVRAFPPPSRLARRPESFFRERMRAGYRAPHIRELARQVARGDIAPDAWRSAREDAGDLRKKLLALPGVGPYAAAHLMRMMGHYQDPGIDSWCRSRFCDLYKRRKVPADRAIAGHYRKYGDFAGLALWLDLTADWHE